MYFFFTNLQKHTNINLNITGTVLYMYSMCMFGSLSSQDIYCQIQQTNSYLCFCRYDDILYYVNVPCANHAKKITYNLKISAQPFSSTGTIFLTQYQ